MDMAAQPNGPTAGRAGLKASGAARGRLVDHWPLLFILAGLVAMLGWVAILLWLAIELLGWLFG